MGPVAGNVLRKGKAKILSTLRLRGGSQKWHFNIISPRKYSYPHINL